jgi:hypothetical protein
MAPPEARAEARAELRSSSRPPPRARGIGGAGPRANAERDAQESGSGALQIALRAIGSLALVGFVLLALRAMSTCDPVDMLAGDALSNGASIDGRGKYGPIADQWLDDAMHEVVSGNKELVRARIYELKLAGSPQVYIGSVRRSGPITLAQDLLIELPSEEAERAAVLEVYEGYRDPEQADDSADESEGAFVRLEL